MPRKIILFFVSFCLALGAFSEGFCAAKRRVKKRPQKKPPITRIENYFARRIPANNQRYATFYKTLQLLTQRKARVLVETGTSRSGCKQCIGDGCATIIFGDFARDQKAILYSVDLDPGALRNAAAAISRNARKNVNLVRSDSVVFLKNFKNKIDFLYMDSFDYVATSPGPSQRHHLREIEAAYPKLHANSVVLIDDCGLPGGGKGRLVIEYLKRKGWKVFQQGYQVIMVYK